MSVRNGNGVEYTTKKKLVTNSNGSKTNKNKRLLLDSGKSSYQSLDFTINFLYTLITLWYSFHLNFS